MVHSSSDRRDPLLRTKVYNDIFSEVPGLLVSPEGFKETVSSSVDLVDVKPSEKVADPANFVSVSTTKANR